MSDTKVETMGATIPPKALPKRERGKLPDKEAARRDAAERAQWEADTARAVAIQAAEFAQLGRDAFMNSPRPAERAAAESAARFARLVDSVRNPKAAPIHNARNWEADCETELFDSVESLSDSMGISIVEAESLWNSATLENDDSLSIASRVVLRVADRLAIGANLRGELQMPTGLLVRDIWNRFGVRHDICFRFVFRFNGGSQWQMLDSNNDILATVSSAVRNRFMVSRGIEKAVRVSRADAMAILIGELPATRGHVHGLPAPRPANRGGARLTLSDANSRASQAAWARFTMTVEAARELEAWVTSGATSGACRIRRFQATARLEAGKPGLPRGYNAAMDQYQNRQARK